MYTFARGKLNKAPNADKPTSRAKIKIIAPSSWLLEVVNKRRGGILKKIIHVGGWKIGNLAANYDSLLTVKNSYRYKVSLYKQLRCMTYKRYLDEIRLCTSLSSHITVHK